MLDCIIPCAEAGLDNTPLIRLVTVRGFGLQFAAAAWLKFMLSEPIKTTAARMIFLIVSPHLELQLLRLPHVLIRLGLFAIL